MNGEAGTAYPGVHLFPITLLDLPQIYSQLSRSSLPVCHALLTLVPLCTPAFQPARDPFPLPCPFYPGGCESHPVRLYQTSLNMRGPHLPPASMPISGV